jgi:hypothetical protein
MTVKRMTLTILLGTTMPVEINNPDVPKLKACLASPKDQA